MKRIKKISFFSVVFKVWIIIAGLIFCTAFTINAEPSKIVSFKGQGIGNKALTLTGILEKPDGEGPFPAVVLLHGARGMSSKSQRDRFNAWVSRLNSWGYVTLLVDSFSTRGHTSIIDNVFAVHPYKRMLDAFSGKSYLAGRSFVDDKRIAVMGWSHGGLTTLYAVDKNHMVRIKSDPFKAAIAFYPWCGHSSIDLSAPLMILIGEKDDWTPAGNCRNLKLAQEATYKITLKVYPRSHHGFDIKGTDMELKGHKIKYNPTAAKDAIVQVKDFLATHLK
jgi:dienelactone hydrolase